MAWRSQKISANPIGQGTRIVPTGTAKPIIATTYYCRSITIRAGVDNSDRIYVGASDIAITDPWLEGGQAIIFEGPTIKSIDLSQIYCIASVADQILDWWALG